MQVVVYFDADGFDLTHDDVTFESFTPKYIDGGNIATYEVHSDDIESFYESLEDCAWCYYQTIKLDD